ncbi:MAG: WbqC family protein [Flavobacteriales bacterium]
MKVLLPITYLGPISYFAFILQAEEVHIESKEHFVKQSLRNRCSIYGANGLQTLTVPKQRKSSDKTLISDINISNKENWQKSHWQSIVSAYNSSPFFEYYKDELQPFYTTKQSNLFDFNLKLTQTILGFLQEEIELNITEEYQHNFKGTDLRHHKFISPQEKYEQVFSEKHDFTPNLSILDLLFNLGPETTSYLERQTI